jgi:hypothetical protein
MTETGILFHGHRRLGADVLAFLGAADERALKMLGPKYRKARNWALSAPHVTV